MVDLFEELMTAVVYTLFGERHDGAFERADV
jgi:hypothetical protein